MEVCPFIMRIPEPTLADLKNRLITQSGINLDKPKDFGQAVLEF